jgi:UDP-N-acetyl-D-mannosaminuronate dehydrogenase
VIGLSIQNSARWIGSSDKKLLKQAKKLWEKIVPVRELPSASFTEALKLLSTTEYGVNIEFARYKKQVADSLGMDYVAMKQWNLDYNNLYQRLGHLEYQKYILDPPEGPKGGHCVTPNAKILNEQYPYEMVKIVGEL